jgi:DNA-binding NarL/FixJ family response regulator
MARILLVEDEADARHMLEIGLERLGHQVIGAGNGEEAGPSLGEGIDVVISDLMMPKLDGIELLKLLAERHHPALRIVITSFADKDRTLQALNLGADYLLEKPFSVERLQAIIVKVQERGDAKRSTEEMLRRQLATLPINEREQALIIYVLKGLPNSRIATLTQSSENAIKSALFQLYRKLGISSRGELFHLIFPI